MYYTSSDSSILELNGTTVQYPALSNGLVSWWRFDEASGTTASPAFGSHSGTVSSPASFGTGKFGNALILTGADGSKATFPAAAGNLGKKFSASFWVKSSGTRNRILSNKETTSGTTGWEIFAGTSTTNLNFYGSGIKTNPPSIYYPLRQRKNFFSIGKYVVGNLSFLHLLAANLLASDKVG